VLLLKPLLIAALAALAAGCASDGSTPLSALGDIECRGKIALTASGNLSISAGASSNSGVLQADCGDGFSLKHMPVAAEVKP
jgi:type IV pilus biogenesis protein CpaD/CtpE